MRSKHIYLIKHGETEENLRGIHQGQAVGGRLSKRGSDDIRKVGDSLAAAGVTVDRMLVSPMSRCRESAALLTATLTPADVRVDERLAAKNSGYLGGRPRGVAAAEAARQGIPIHQLRTPGGESSEDVQSRYMQLWDEVCAGPHRTTVLIGHGGGIACLLLRLTGNGFDRYLDHVPGSAGVTWVEIDDQAPCVRLMNVPVADLPGRLSPRTAR
ncbi:histidine phosphatase family protein [Streptomyces olivaceus]|uniref:Histidine phosphatase family protein n=1 Tax=Streptomyces olivaceus TaxID=47716 RepID=A0ABS7WDS7_STROV|nr:MULTISPECIES: histidine phosphatase family protein [Streptomyces]KUL51025.1 fructose-2,6-bisphosphatase [Streptomyces sp. NRRL S-1521]MBZ6093279.1 histidine phosphatase family protein [Streptomyces olivaceus]MBZ6100298.1 histidine phosphatase family protein [Streptomyces olivaceus]MBZ6121462.1 histidine phosphatase family protein [Streptomyces olivaceus]MBZ6156112.1 histidine phosphatase family protein [Streptomyces olivaceus]